MPKRVTDSEGRARIGGLPRHSKVSIRCRCDGYLVHGDRDRVCLTREAGTTAEIEVRLRKNPTWQEEGELRPWGGYVRDKRGMPVEGAVVRVGFRGSASLPSPGGDKLLQNRILFSGRSSRTGFNSIFETDKSGRFQGMIPLIPGVHTIESLWVIHPDHPPLSISGDEFTGDVTEDLTLVLEDISAWIPGLVLTERGEPLGGCLIDCRVTVNPTKGGIPLSTVAPICCGFETADLGHPL